MSPQAAQRQRNHGYFAAFDDLGDAALELADLARARQLAFREDANQFAFMQCLRDINESLFHQERIFLGRRNRYRLGRAEDPAQEGSLENPVVHHEADGTRTGRHDDDGIHITDMVTHQHGRAFVGNTFAINHFDPVHGLYQYPRQEAHQEFRHQREDISGHQRIEDGGDQEQLRYRETLAQQHDGHASRGHHEQGFQNIHAGDRARNMFWVATGLYQRKQGNDEKAAKHADHDDVDQDARHACLGNKTQRIDHLRIRIRITGKEQVDAEQRQADETERHQANLDLVSRQALAQQGTGAYADRKHGQQQDEYAVVAMQEIFRIHGELRKDQGAIKPEPGVAQHGQEDGTVLARKTQVTVRFSNEIDTDLQFRLGRRRARHAVAGDQAQQGYGNRCTGHQLHAQRIVHDQHGTQYLAQQDADKGAHLDKAIAADQFLGFQLLRQIRIFDGAEQGRMHAHAHHGRHQQPQGVRHPAGGGHRHDSQLHPFHETRQTRLFKLVGQLARRA